ncbi:MAG TPA: methyltransferase [Pirellulaceae bacterium]|nr:methyltransferase [Pirellulaceae bacterium]
MPLSALTQPTTDPVSIFEHYRGNYATELLVAAIAEFKFFDELDRQLLDRDTLRAILQMQERPFAVLTTALRAMGLVHVDSQGRFGLTAVAEEHLRSEEPFYVGDYVSLAVKSPGVQEMIQRLKTNKPAGESKKEGTAFIYKEGRESAMEHEASARFLTLALAGRAKNVAPYLAAKIALPGVTKLLDVGGGTGIYSIALLQKNPELRAVVYDRPEVLKVAAEMAESFGVANRLELVPGDMFTGQLPQDCQAILLSNVLHDWDVPENQQLIKRCAEVLPTGGRLLIHDVFLNDALDGPLPIALYSAALFTLTEGRAYSVAEFSSWLKQAGLTPQPVISTLVHCGVLTGIK